MKKGKLFEEFSKFQKNESIQAKELKKVSGGTCIFYTSHSQSDCDRDDQTYTYFKDYKDIDAVKEPAEPSAD